MSIVKALIKLGLTKYVNLSYRSVINGQSITTPIINGLGKGNMVLNDLWMIGVMRKLFALKKGAIVDVGVNIGQTLIKVRSIDRDVKYFGFEPNPVCVYYVRELIKANSFQNTVVIPVGIADEDRVQVLNFYTDGDVDSSASIMKDFRPQRIFRKEYVACLQYGSFSELLRNEPISILKIDVEGAELQVLKSLTIVLKEKRPFVLIEILPAYAMENTQRVGRQKEIEEMMKQLSYQILRIHKSEFGFSKLDQIEINPKIEDCDYLLCPSEAVSSVYSG